MRQFDILLSSSLALTTAACTGSGREPDDFNLPSSDSGAGDTGAGDTGGGDDDTGTASDDTGSTDDDTGTASDDTGTGGDFLIGDWVGVEMSSGAMSYDLPQVVFEEVGAYTLYAYAQLFLSATGARAAELDIKALAGVNGDITDESQSYDLVWSPTARGWDLRVEQTETLLLTCTQQQLQLACDVSALRGEADTVVFERE